MKKAWFSFAAAALFLILSTLSLSAQNDGRGYKVKVGDQVPEFDIELTDGTKIPVSSLKGKVVMFQFTASWCPVCIKEMPHIENEIWKELQDNKEFALYGIDLKETREKVEAFAKRVKVTYPLTLDEKGEKFALFTEKGAGVTRNVILDRKGKIIFLTRLYDEAEFAEMIEVIKKELAR